MLAAVIFDLDGVLVDSEGAGLAIARRIVRDAGLVLDEDELARFVGVTDSEFYHALATRYPNFDAKTSLARHQREYHETLDDLPEIPEAIACANECWRRGIRLAVVTGSLRLEATRILKRLKIDDLFSVVVTADDVELGKPDPAGYRMAVRQLRVQEAQTVVIEDSDAGIAAARKAHLAVVAIRSSNPATQSLVLANRTLESAGQLCVNVFEEVLRPTGPATLDDEHSRHLERLGLKLRELISPATTADDDPWRWLTLRTDSADYRWKFVRGEEVDRKILDAWLDQDVVAALEEMNLLVRQRQGWALCGCCVAPLGVPLLLPERPTMQASGEWRSTHVYLDVSSIRYVQALDRAVDGWVGRHVLEMGSGSGLLLAKAAMAGARPVVGVDLDAASVHATRLNLALGGIKEFSAVQSDMFESLAEYREAFDVITFHPPYRIVPSELDYPNPVQRVGVGPFGLDLVRRFVEGAAPFLCSGGKLYVYLQTPEGPGLSLCDDLCRWAASGGLRALHAQATSYETIENVARGVGNKFPVSADYAIEITASHYRSLGIQEFANRLFVAER